MSALREGAREVFRRNARTFWLAARLLPRGCRDDAALLYAFCRRVDDLADRSPDAERALLALDALADEIRGSSPPGPLVSELHAAAARLDLPLSSALDLIAGVRSDLGSVRVADDAELLRYAYRVASTVGLMMCAVLRVHSRQALPHAVDLGIAMQLTNIARDVREDAAGGRVYLPAARLVRAGTTPAAVVNGTAPPAAVARVVGEILGLADDYYRSADEGMRDLPLRVRPAILVASRVYRAIGVRLRRNGCDALRGRTIVPWPEKLYWAARALAASSHPRILGVAPRGPHDHTLHTALQGLPGIHSRPGPRSSIA
jgi:15-cis-phytoene synthase